MAAAPPHPAQQPTMSTAVLPPPAPTGPLSPTPESPTRARGSVGSGAGEPGPAARDPVFWTELEIRRLGNLIAASIEARAFVGPSDQASGERKQMRVYLDAMKRKAFRVLERAEQFALSPQHEWPGLDPTVADPVALADEYVKVVQDYLAVLAAEEDAAATAAADAADEADATPDPGVADPSAESAPDDADAAATAGATDEGTDAPGASDDWVAADDEAYREALERERDALEKGRAERDERTALLEGDGLRRRRGGDGEGDDADAGAEGKMSAADEELMARHKPVQDDLTANLVDLVGQLKGSVADNRDKLKADADVLDTADSAVDASLAAIKRQRENLSSFTQASTTSWWLILAAAAVVVVVFLFVFLLLRVPM